MDVATERQHLLDQIGQRVNPRHQAKMSMVVPTGLEMYGVRVPQVREIARAWQHAHKKVAREHLVALVEVLWKESLLCPSLVALLT